MANADAFNDGFNAGLGKKKDKDNGSDTKQFGGIYAKPKSYKKGGKVKKTGYALVHKNELVVSAKKAGRVKRLMRKSGRKVSRKRAAKGK